ncbi:hypothetical protein [Cupriavidus basilensis]|jgi:hypothetical protein|uniref:hypothetical protein n=1 Tax=Cupriavidus basilensis TaxID=68895 RepID=UPI0023E83640|nr:hypothetical protein [Cupriavidus basilensis]MDF3881089.1 hypothetical protein [Cupriavidus basilensis]
MRKLLMAAAAIVTLLAGCGNQTGEEYIGKWVNIKSEKRTLDIERNGDGFMVRNTEPSAWDGKIETKNIPAVLKDGALQVQTGGLGPVLLMVDKATGHLTSGPLEYKRDK